jgi:transposase
VLAADHLARVVDEFVESLPVQRLNRRYEHTPGEAAYDLRLLCKVWIFAYARGLTSARELARQCEENLAFRFLTDGHCPNHRTLSGFRRRYRRLLRWVFAKTVLVGRQMGLVRLGLVAIDSVKLQADACASRRLTAEQLKEVLGKLDSYLAELEAQDQRDDRQYGEAADAESLPQKLCSLQRRRNKLARALDKLQRDQQREIKHDRAHRRRDVIPTDPDAVWVKKKGRIIPGYNAHAAVDDTCGMVVAVQAQACTNEREALNPMLQQVRRTTGSAAKTALADNGYYSDTAVAEAENGPTCCYVPDGPSAQSLNKTGTIELTDPYHCDRFAYDAASDRFTCPQNRALVLDRYRVHRGEPRSVYQSEDCSGCPVRAACTSSADGLRTIEVHRQYALVRRAKERLRSADGQSLYRKRKTIVEPVFGQWQHNRGVKRLRLRGVRGCDIELHLLAIGHNLKKFWAKAVKFGPN